MLLTYLSCAAEQNNRPTFKNAGGMLLHHTSEKGDGTWMLVDKGGGLVGFVASWAMHPTHIKTVSPASPWSFVKGGTHQADEDTFIECVGQDRSVHIQAVGSEGSKTADIMRGFFFTSRWAVDLYLKLS